MGSKSKDIKCTCKAHDTQASTDSQHSANTDVPEMTYNVFSGTLNPTHSLTYNTDGRQ